MNSRRLVVVLLALLVLVVGSITTGLLARKHTAVQPVTTSSTQTTQSSASNQKTALPKGTPTSNPNANKLLPPAGANAISPTIVTPLIQNDDYNPGTFTTNGSIEPTPGWFVVYVTYVNEYGTFHLVSIVQQDSTTGDYDVKYGGATSYPLAALQQDAIPEAVIKQVPTF